MAFEGNLFILDRTWIDHKLPLRSDGQVEVGLNPEYINGVQAFLDFAEANPSNLSFGKLICPCQRYKLRFREVKDIIFLYLLKYGFMTRYYTWTSHGEVHLPT